MWHTYKGRLADRCSLDSKVKSTPLRSPSLKIDMTVSKGWHFARSVFQREYRNDHHSRVQR
uniref:Uncharacterized protein n=1 Tax=Anguilla anguilla TaxID=7936 RepID=A0A0E9RYK8_ANGAN